MDISDYDEDVASIIEEDEDESMGSLKDFIVDDSEDEEGETATDDVGSGSASSSDIDDLKMPDSIDTISTGEHKILTTKRVRKPVDHYVPENVQQLMLTKGGKVDPGDLYIDYDTEEEYDLSDEDDEDYVEDDDDEEDYELTDNDDDNE